MSEDLMEDMAGRDRKKVLSTISESVDPFYRG